MTWWCTYLNQIGSILYSSFFVSLIFVTGFQFDYVFDWTILKYQQSQLATPPARALVRLLYLSYSCCLLLVDIHFCNVGFNQVPGAGTSAATPHAMATADRHTGNLLVALAVLQLFLNSIFVYSPDRQIGLVSYGRVSYEFPSILFGFSIICRGWWGANGWFTFNGFL